MMESWITVYLFIVVICVAISRFGLKLFRAVKITNKISGPTFYELITVHVKHIWSDAFLTHTGKLCAAYGYKPAGAWLGHNYIAFISDPSSVHEVYKQTSNKSSCIYDAIKTYLGEASLVLNGRKWRHHRNITNLLFHKAIMDQQRIIYHEEAEDLVKQIQEKANNQDVEINSLIGEQLIGAVARGFTSDAFSFEENGQFLRDMAATMDHCQVNIVNPLHTYIGRKLPWGRRADSLIHSACNKYRSQFAALRKSADDRFKTEKYDRSNPLDCLVRGNLKTGNVFTEQEFCGEFLLLFIAGSETTANTTVLLLLLLALHQEAQQRVFEEIESIFGQSQRTITTHDLGEMEYLERVIKETLRLFPTVPMVAKQIERDTNINGTKLPRGSSAVIHLMALHRNPQNFKNPMKFDPDRFLPEASAEHHPFGYLPYSYGEQNCPGSRQGMMAVKIFASAILRNYKVLPADGLRSIDDIKVKMCVVMHAYDSRVRFVCRNREESSHK